jgi:hypothetical protein
MSSPGKSFMMNGVDMMAPAYEYDNFDNDEEDEEEEEGEYENEEQEQEQERGQGYQGRQGELSDAIALAAAREEEEQWQGGAQYEGEEEEGDYEEEEEGGEEGALRALKADAPPAPMPTQFYSEFDSFMSRPTPKFSAAAGGGKGLSKKKGEEERLPRVGPGLGIAAASDRKKSSSVSSKIKSKISASRQAAGGAERPLDPALLQAAFAYTDRVQQEAYEEEGDGDGEGEGEGGRARPRGLPAKSGSAPQLSKPKQSSNNVAHLNPYERQQLARGEKKHSSSSGKGKGRQAKGEGVVKRLRSKTAIEAPDAFSNISASGLEHSRSKGGGLDYQSLVENFENGTTLLKLKAELAASRQSMADSENFMRQLSKEYSTKKRR